MCGYIDAYMLGFLVLINIKPGGGGNHLFIFCFKLSDKVNIPLLVTAHKYFHSALRETYLYLLFVVFTF